MTSFNTCTKTGKLLAMPIANAIKHGIIGKNLIINTLEGPVKGTPDAILCKGAAGELWPQKADKIAKNYVDSGVTEKDGNHEWTIYIPDQNRVVFALKVDCKDSFEVDASWDRLKGKKGDYLLADNKANQPDTDNMWIVDAAIFEATYKTRIVARTSGCCGGTCTSK